LSSCHHRVRVTWTPLLVAASLSLAALAALGSVASAQQHADRNGMAFSAEAGPLGKKSLFTLSSAKADLRRVDLRILEGARVPSVKRAAGLRVGTLTADGVGSPLALTVPRGGASASDVTLAHHGALRVTFAPGSKTFISITGLPAKTRSVELSFRGGKGQVVTSAGCEDEQNFRATITRAGAKKAVTADAGVTC